MNSFLGKNPVGNNLVKGKSTDSSYRGERSNDKINVCRIGKQEV